MKKNFRNEVPENLIDTFMEMNGMEELDGELFEDAGGAIWHISNIEEAIQIMPENELLELQDESLLMELGI